MRLMIPTLNRFLTVVGLIEFRFSPATKRPIDVSFDTITTMKQTGKCPKCGSLDIIADAKAIDRAHGNSMRDMSVATFGNPKAMIFKDKKETAVSAWVCEDCGFVEYYADYPMMLK